MKFGLVEYGAAAWGFVEATLFFIVPDVWLTTWAVRSPIRALWGCILAVCGAVAGGALMYSWGHEYPTTAIDWVGRVPAVSDEMIATVDETMQERGPIALFGGMFTGVPYKLYAVAAGAQRISIIEFLAFSLPARLARFLALTLITILMARLTRHCISHRTQRTLVFACWCVFYIVFFIVMPN